MISAEWLLAVCGGVALAVPYVLFARRARVFGVGLMVAAVVYVGFAVAGGTGREVLTEAIGVVVFATLTVLGIRRSGYFLALGWAAHVGWDVLLHPMNASSYVPWWYPAMCIGFDLVVAAAIVRATRRTRR